MINFIASAVLAKAWQEEVDAWRASKSKEVSAPLRGAWLEAVAAYYEKYAAKDRNDPNVGRFVGACDVAYERVRDLQEMFRTAFAKSRGWRYDAKQSLHDFTARGKWNREILHNAEGYRDADGVLVGFVTHSQATPDEIASYAAQHGYNAERLPFSWLDPSGYPNCVLLTLQTGTKWPGKRK